MMVVKSISMSEEWNEEQLILLGAIAERLPQWEDLLSEQQEDEQGDNSS